MELDTFVPFHAKPGAEDAIVQAMHDACADVRAEPGCVFIGYYRSIQDRRLFYIHSRWKDLAAFEVHAELPHTLRFIATMEPLIEHPVKALRMTQFL